MSFIYTRRKNHFDINAFAHSLAFKQRLGHPGDALLSSVEEKVWMIEIKDIRKRQLFNKSLLFFSLVAVKSR